MPTFEQLLKEKNKRLYDIPNELLTVVEKQQKIVLDDIIIQLSKLTTVNGQIKIDSGNIKQIALISDELKSVFLNEEYLEAVKKFSSEFVIQANINDELIKKGFGEIDNPVASRIYIDTAKKNAVAALTSESNFIKPIEGILENAVVNGATLKETIDSIRLFTEGNPGVDSKIIKYVKQISSDSFAISDRSYTSILSDYLDNDWYYYSGGEIATTRCFCDERVGHYFHYKEIESWGNGDNLGSCDIGGGMWAGEIPGTNSATIFSYLGGYNCLHSLIPVSEFDIPEEDLQRTRNLGYIE